MKESVVRHEYGSDCRRHNVRFEERAKEFILLAKANSIKEGAVGKPTSP